MAPSPTARNTDPAARAASPQAKTPGTPSPSCIGADVQTHVAFLQGAPQSVRHCGSEAGSWHQKKARQRDAAAILQPHRRSCSANGTDGRFLDADPACCQCRPLFRVGMMDAVGEERGATSLRDQHSLVEPGAAGRQHAQMTLRQLISVATGAEKAIDAQRSRSRAGQAVPP
jgi:hypothetical protein